MTEKRISEAELRKELNDSVHARIDPSVVESAAAETEFTPVTEPSLADLFAGLSSDFSTLVRKEAELARAETMQTIRTALRSALMIVASGLVAYTGVVIVLAAISVWLGTVVDSLWLGTLIVGAVMLIIGLVLYIAGRGSMEEISMTPERTVETLQDDAEWAKEKLNESV